MNKTLKNYAIWQAICDLEMYCRSRRNGTQLQIECEDRATKPVVEYALKILELCNVTLIKDPYGFANISIDYDRSKNEFFGRP
jgi:hypothetical protein